MQDQSPKAPRTGDLIADKYCVEEILGVGGMGMVVAARHTTLDQKVAVKFLRGEAIEQSELVSRFLQEARASFGLRGDHAVRVFDVGTLPNGAPYMVMELLRGNDLRTELDRRPQLPVGEAVDLILQTIEGIAEAHSLGIVHRDLKPSNLFLAVRPDGSRSVKVLDFGVSKLLRDAAEPAQQGLTETAAMLGSPQYMSPEQIRSAREVDERTDIWSLGVVLYELLTGRVPFAGETLSAVSASIVADDPRDPVALRADLPFELVEVMMCCLAKDRRLRYQTVAELAQALLPFGPPDSTARIDRISGIQSARQRQLAALKAGDGDQIATLPAVVDAPVSSAPAASRQAASRRRVGAESGGGTLAATSSHAAGANRRGSVRYAGMAIIGALVGGLIVVWMTRTRPADAENPENGAAISSQRVQKVVPSAAPPARPPASAAPAAEPSVKPRPTEEPEPVSSARKPARSPAVHAKSGTAARVLPLPELGSASASATDTAPTSKGLVPEVEPASRSGTSQVKRVDPLGDRK